MVLSDIEKLQQWIIATLPARSDVIVWLQGDRFDRGRTVLKLFKEHLSPKIFLTGNNVLIGKKMRAGENNVSLSAMQAWLIRSGVPSSVITVDTKAMNTKEQADNIISFMKKNRWHRLLLVGSTHHQLRPFLTLLQAGKRARWNGEIINQPRLLTWSDFPGGRNIPAAAVWKQEIKKLSLYRPNVANPSRGIAYFRLNHKFSPLVLLRSATMKDAVLLYRWRIDPTARKQFFNSGEFSFDAHKKWLSQKVHSRSIFLYIILSERSTPVGQVRFDVTKKTAVMSITISKQNRGKGFGKAAITAGVRQFLLNHDASRNGVVRELINQYKTAHLFNRGIRIAHERHGRLNTDVANLISKQRTVFT